MASIHDFSLSLANSLNCDKKRKLEYFCEFSDHLCGIKEELILEGCSEEEAEARAVEAFGEKKAISRALNKELFYFGGHTQSLFKIFFAICTIFICMCFVAEPFRSVLRTAYYKGRLLTAQEISSEVSDTLRCGRAKVEMNMIPFNKIRHDMASGTFGANNFVKVLLFVPIGFFFHSLLDRKKLPKYIFSILFIFGLEFIQHWLAIGIGDIDDSISYFLGFLAGIFVFQLTVFLFGKLSQLKI